MAKDYTPILYVGGIVIAAYAAYKLLNPIANTVSGVGSGIDTAVQGLGSGLAGSAGAFESYLQNASGSASGVIGQTGNTVNSLLRIPESAANAVTGGINSASNKLQQLLGSGSSSYNSVQPKTQITRVSASNPIQKITTTTVYGSPVSQVQTSEGTVTIPNTPNTYNPSLMIGFNSAGQGYSAAPSKIQLAQQSNPFTQNPYS